MYHVVLSQDLNSIFSINTSSIVPFSSRVCEYAESIIVLLFDSLLTNNHAVYIIVYYEALV
jgi:hypothetical protein